MLRRLSASLRNRRDPPLPVRDVIARDVPTLIRTLLDRDPTADELAALDGRDLHAVGAEVAASHEHAQGVADGAARGVLVGSPVAVRQTPVGTESPDGVAVVGRDGWLFIVHGANDFVRQFRGEFVLGPEQVVAWQDLLTAQRATAAEMGVGLSQLVIPDKLAVKHADFPEPLPRSGPRPIEQVLASGGGDLLYPLEALRRRARHGDVYFRGDSHTTPAGADILYAGVMAQLSRAPVADLISRPVVQGVMLGDLGAKYEPAQYEIVDIPLRSEHLSLVEDNADDILPLGGHLGVRRVVRNAAPVYDETVVVFGDSYSYIDLDAPGNVGELLASTFRETHFLWAPFCWDSAYVRDVRPQHVVLQMAERFAVLTPRMDIDIRELARETVRRKAGISPEEVTGPEDR